jgi:hypothetical protein
LNILFILLCCSVPAVEQKKPVRPGFQFSWSKGESEKADFLLKKNNNNKKSPLVRPFLISVEAFPCSLALFCGQLLKLT